MELLIVDKHVLFREGLVNILSNQPDFDVVGVAGSASEAIEKTLELKPDLVLIDPHLPDGDGCKTIRTIFSKRPATKIVVLTIDDSVHLLYSVILNGAVGYLIKNNISQSELLLSLRALKRGEAALSRKMVSLFLNEFQQTQNNNNNDLKLLTPRELDVLQLLSEDVTNREIARQLVISENTVKVHVHNILDKLNLKSRRQAGKLARYHGNNYYD